MKPNEVKTETENCIVVVSSGWVLYGSYSIFSIVVALFMLWGGISCFADLDIGLLELFIGLFCILIGGALILMNLQDLLINESVIIDKRLRNIIIKKDSFIKYLKSIKEIPSSHVKEIEIIYWTRRWDGFDYDSPAGEPGDSWIVSLNTIYEDSVIIYGGGSKPEAEKIAKKVCGIAGTNVTRLSRRDLPELP